MSLTDLAPERIFGELHEALLKAREPSIFFEEMRHMGHLSFWFPEIEALIGVPQNPVHHPEGDVWTHTMMVLDAAAELRSGASYPEGFMMSALTHDFGKAVSTVAEGHKISAIGHEKTGVELTRQFLRRISNENKMERYVLNMVELHMKPNMLASERAGRKSTSRMFDQSVCPGDLLLLAKADHFGKGNAEDYSATETFLQERLSYFEELMSRPYVQGRDLVEAGVKPGADFSEALAYSHKMRLAGVQKKEALAHTLAFIRKLRTT
jgi:tRNA nucleotidyltransferase (CCA-adding enzyme)